MVESPAAEKRHRVEWDPRDQILSVDDCRYSIQVFEMLQEGLKKGELFKFVANDSGTIWIERIPPPEAAKIEEAV